MPNPAAATIRLRGWAAGRPTAGLGVLVAANQVVTCAHVVNAALGRGLRDPRRPGESDLVQVEFPLLEQSPVRLARVVAWAPPLGQDGGGDVAGLVLTEGAPVDAAPARFAADGPGPWARLQAFGYPDSPPRSNGMWVDIELKGQVGRRLIQVESLSGQTVKAQPGYSGSAAWDPATGQTVGLLQVAPFADEPERDAYLLPPLAIAEAWEEPFGYLLMPENPYRGLEPFTASHAAMFFGRDDDITELTGRVRRQPVTVVAGPSGAGKSSMVLAGLIPALQREQQWSVALARPGEDPWLRLATALLQARHSQQATVTLEESSAEVARLQQDGLGPIGRFLRSQNRPLLVVVDQFEELLASGPPDHVLLDLLLPAPETVEVAVRVVLVLRSDFLPSLESIPGFHTRLNERLYFLSPLTADQMRRAITYPATAREVSFEPHLVKQMLDDAADGTLPLLEFTLTRLWETQRNKTLNLVGYHQMGGVHGALDQFAEESAARLTGTSAKALDQVLLKLVRAHGLGPVTRQRVLEADVTAADWDVLLRLADARLVILDTDTTDRRPYAELAHESLVTSWKRLKNLVKENSEFLNWLGWVEGRDAEGDWIPEVRIAEALHWLDLRRDSIPDRVKTFIRSSLAAANARRELAMKQQQAQVRIQENERLERALLPTPILSDPRLSISARSRPRAVGWVIGGQFYDVVEGADGWAHVLIGEVRGRGPDAAALGVSLRVAWRTLVLAGSAADKVFSTANDLFMHERTDNEMSATLCMLSVAPNRGSAMFRSAGHLPPLLITDDEVLEPQVSTGPPLGTADQQGWPLTQVQLNDNWSILVYTSGLVEGRGGNSSARLGSEGLTFLLNDALRSRPSEAPQSSGGALTARNDDMLLDQVLMQAIRLNSGEADDLAALVLSCHFPHG